MQYTALWSIRCVTQHTLSTSSSPTSVLRAVSAAPNGVLRFFKNSDDLNDSNDLNDLRDFNVVKDSKVIRILRLFRKNSLKKEERRTGLALYVITGREIPNKQYNTKTHVRQGSTLSLCNPWRQVARASPSGTQAGCKMTSMSAPLYLPFGTNFSGLFTRQMHPAFQRFAMQR